MGNQVGNMKHAWLTDAKTKYDFLMESPAPATSSDMILALGSHDKRVPLFAADLYLAGAAPFIVCAGGLGRITRDIWEEPEADIFGRICVERGVPSESVLLERNSTNTEENFVFTKRLMEKNGLGPQS